MALCPFCQNDYQLAQTTRLGGFDICDQCYHGDLPNRLRLNRGWEHQIKQWEQEFDDYVIYHTEIIVEIPGGLPLSFLSKRRNWFRKLFGFLYKGIKTDDPLFNKMVYTTSKQEEPVLEWLANEQAQSILMDLLGDFKTVRVSPECIYGKHTSDEYTNPQPIFVELAALGECIQRHFQA